MPTDHKVLKERAIFYLGRKLGEISQEMPSHEGMAQAGVPYSDRTATLDRLEKEKKETENEREAWQWVLSLVMEAESK